METAIIDENEIEQLLSETKYLIILSEGGLQSRIVFFDNRENSKSATAGAPNSRPGNCVK